MEKQRFLSHQFFITIQNSRWSLRNVVQMKTKLNESIKLIHNKDTMWKLLRQVANLKSTLQLNAAIEVIMERLENI